MSLRVISVAATASVAKEWAANVLCFAHCRDHWPPSSSDFAFRPERGKPINLFALMELAFTSSWGGEPDLRILCQAMHAWEEEGHIDSLSPQLLKAYVSAKVLGPKRAGAKRDPPARWKSASILDVAALVKRRGTELRHVLQLDVGRDKIPSMLDKLKTAEATAHELERAAALASKQHQLVKDRERKAAARCKVAKAVKKAAVQKTTEKFRVRCVYVCVRVRVCVCRVHLSAVWACAGALCSRGRIAPFPRVWARVL